MVYMNRGGGKKSSKGKSCAHARKGKDRSFALKHPCDYSHLPIENSHFLSRQFCTLCLAEPYHCQPQYWSNLRQRLRKASVLPFVGSSNTGCRTVQINALNGVSDVVAFADEVAKVLASDLGLILELGRLLPLALKLFDAALQADTEFICGMLERLAHLGADARCIGMRVIEQFKLCCELGGKTTRERFRNGLQGIGDAETNCKVC